MLAIEDVLSKVVREKWAWPSKNNRSPLLSTYKSLRLVLGEGDLGMSAVHSGRSNYRNSVNVEASNGMVIMFQNVDLLKELNNKKYIYLTPEKLFMESTLGLRDSYEYIAILKREGRIGYCVLILGFESMSYDFDAPDHEIYGGNCCLMEILSDGTTILFERTVSWEKLKECKVNTTSIMNLFFSEKQVKLIASIVDDLINDESIDKDEVYNYRHEDHELEIFDPYPYPYLPNNHGFD